MAQSSIDDTLHMASVSQPANPVNPVSVSSSEGIRRNVLNFFSHPTGAIPEYVKSAIDNIIAMVNKDNINVAISALNKIVSRDKDAFVQYMSQVGPDGMNLMQRVVKSMPVEVANTLGDFFKQYIPKNSGEFIMETVREPEQQQIAPRVMDSGETSPMPSELAQQTFSATSPMAPVASMTQQKPQESEDTGFLQTIKNFFGKPLGLAGGDSYDTDKDLTTEQLIEKVINGTLDGGASMISGSRHANRYFDYSVSGGAKKKRSSKKLRDISRETNDIHERTVAAIKKLMKCTDEEAQAYKSVLYRRVKAEHPELSSKDRALKMEESATKEALKAIDIAAEMKQREIWRSEHPPKDRSEKSEKIEKSDKSSEKKTKKSKKTSDSSDSFNLSM